MPLSFTVFSAIRHLPSARLLHRLLASGLLSAPLVLTGHAQAPTPPPTWDAAVPSSPTQNYGLSQTQAVATDASGNVFVTGYFSGLVSFGSTRLLSAGGNDLFVAKYVPSSGTWAWAQRAGGTGDDYGYGVAVSGTSVYVAGSLTTNSANTTSVTFGSGSPVSGASSTSSADLVLAKYTDNGASGSYVWSQVGGGTGDDYGYGVAVSGTSVYVTGSVTNDLSNGSSVVFGTGSPVNGASSTSSADLLLVKYSDHGASGNYGWSQVGGGSGSDGGYGVAASGASVYVTGSITNNSNNGNNVVFGGGSPVSGASNTANQDLLLAKYADNGTSGSYVWSQVGGGISNDQGFGIAVNGTSLYVTGYLTSNTSNGYSVVFGGSGATAGSVPVNGASAMNSQDLLLVKYTDNGTSGSYVWSQVGGGTGGDIGYGVAVSGTSVYVTGYLTNSTNNARGVVLGATGTTAGTTSVNGATSTSSSDVVLARYTDNGATGSYKWNQVGGGSSFDQGYGVAVSGLNVYVGALLGGSLSGYTFNSASTLSLQGTLDNRAVLAQATDGGSSGSWTTLTASLNGGGSTVRAMTSDASGNLFVTGNFSGAVDFGGTRLVSMGGNDLFVAKYVPGSGWAWAQSAGGTNNDYGYGIAVSGPSVYVTGYITTTKANASGVLFGGNSPVNGTSTSSNADLVLAKYTDNGTSGSYVWSQVGGGTGADLGNAVVVSGSSVYVAGYLTNTLNNSRSVVFGGGGATAGTVPVNGASSTSGIDLVLVKYTDNGATGSYGWSQVGGGSGNDIGFGVAASGANIYVTGYIINTLTNANNVVFGGDGTTAGTIPVNGASNTSSQDLLLVKYTDNGTTGSYGWSQVGGGTGLDYGYGVAVNGANVYVTGNLVNTLANASNVLFGGGGTITGTASVNGTSSVTSADLLLAKYTDNGTSGSYGWSQVGGGTGGDIGYAVAVSGSSIYVAGYLTNTLTNSNNVVFGGGGTTAGTVTVNGASSTSGFDLVLSKYSDNGATGSYNWSQVGGGTGTDYGYGVATQGKQVYAAGSVLPAATFGPFTLPQPEGAPLSVLASLTDNSIQPLPVVLVSFTAQPAAAGVVQLTWTTASEVNSARFEVERSYDGQQFTYLSQIPAASSSAQARYYSYWDTAATISNSYYYRLRVVDLDGAMHYSPVVVVTPRAAGLQVYPNPVHNQPVTLTGAPPTQPVRVLNLLGQVVRTVYADATGVAHVRDLAPGLYIVQTTGGTVRLSVN